MGAGFLLGKLKESYCFEDLGIERRIILRWVFRNSYVSLWPGFI